MTMKRAASASLAVKAKKKETGAHFTPPDLATFIAERLMKYGDLSRPSLRVLDPSCGDGELLLSFYRALPPKKRRAAELIGMDVDGEAVGEAARRLAGIDSKVSLGTGDFLEAAVTLERAELLGPHLRPDVLRRHPLRCGGLRIVDSRPRIHHSEEVCASESGSPCRFLGSSKSPR